VPLDGVFRTDTHRDIDSQHSKRSKGKFTSLIQRSVESILKHTANALRAKVDGGAEGLYIPTTQLNLCAARTI